MATMTSSAAGGVPYKVPREPHPASSLLMAVVVHAALLGFLWVGVSWQNTEPTAVEAEVWDMKTEDAAPPAPRPEPEPEPVKPEPVRPTPPPPPRPAPVPEPKVVPKVIPKVVELPSAPKAPDIALERVKEQKKKLLEKKLAEEKLLKEKELKEKQKELAEQKQVELAETKAKELADKKAKELADKKAAEKADKLAKAAREAGEKALQDKLRAAEMKRITGAAGRTGAAEKSTSPHNDSGYKAAISAKIKGNTRYAGDNDGPGNPKVEFRIDQLPTGEIISIRKTKASGVPAFDEAVERAINNSSPLPKAKDGTVARSLLIEQKLKDFSEAN